MRTTAWSSLVAGLLAAGCAADADDGDYQILPGSSGDPGTHGASPVLRGRVCVAMDLRDFGTCSEDAAGGLAVSTGGASAITDDDGGFELPREAAAGGDLMVTGPGVIPTFNPFSPSGIPVVTAIDADVYARELSSNGVMLPADTGAILGRVIGGTGASPARGIGVTSLPAAPFGSFYDGIDAFSRDRTGARGVFFVPGLAAGTTQLTFRDLATTGEPGETGETIVNGVTVRNGGITILDSVTMP